MLIRQDFSKVFLSDDNPDLTGVAPWGKALHRQSLAKQGLEEFQDRHSRGEVPIAELVLSVRVAGGTPSQ